MALDSSSRTIAELPFDWIESAGSLHDFVSIRDIESLQNAGGALSKAKQFAAPHSSFLKLSCHIACVVLCEDRRHRISANVMTIALSLGIHFPLSRTGVIIGVFGSDLRS